MYKVQPLGINTKDNDRNAKDGFLEKSINLQMRDGSMRPIPERLVSEINASEHSNIILHKVSDENQINVLGYRTQTPIYLASDLSSYMGGTPIEFGNLEWFGKIVDGVYSTITPVDLGVTRTDGLSFTILNGLIYMMGDGSSTTERYYLRLQFKDGDDEYEVKDMYAWKSLIPFYPIQGAINITATPNTINVLTQCGFILIRFAIAIKSGDVVLHSPIYVFSLVGLNRSDTDILIDTTIDNIHSFVNMNLEYLDDTLFEEEVSSINIYATTPYYESKLKTDYTTTTTDLLVDSATIIQQIRIKSEEPFYLIKTISAPTDDKMLLLIEPLDSDITYSETVSKVYMNTIAAGEVMPVDNYTYHKVFGEITSFGGRLVINSPTTVLSEGHIRSLATVDNISDVGFRLDSEDGKINGISYEIDKALEFNDVVTPHQIRPRGVLSYPNISATTVGGSSAINGKLRLVKTSKNALHNLACAFDIFYAASNYLGISVISDILITSDYNITLIYNNFEETAISQPTVVAKYSSENRAQFSDAGEFSVWPALNSYRIGEGKIMFVGANNVDPANSEIIAALAVGTTDGLYTINLDPSGNNFIASITRRASIPALSKEALQIGESVLFVSDKGLMAYNSGRFTNLTADYFPDHIRNTVPENNLPNYSLLYNMVFDPSIFDFTMGDVVSYLKGAKLAYDGRRNTVWCSNPEKDFSLVFNIDYKMWGFSTFVFSEKLELFSSISTDYEDTYSYYLVRKNDFYDNNLYILSGENTEEEVSYLLLTRPMKLTSPDRYKKIKRMFSRCDLLKKEDGDGHFVFGIWGKQDLNERKMNLPISLVFSMTAFNGNTRQDIPHGWSKGKYKAITIMQGGMGLPDSSIDMFEFDAVFVDDARLR